jgi:hypothetical protein
MSDNAPLSGKIPFAVGQASVVRIPVPGTQRPVDCKVIGAGGAAAGTAVTPGVGTAVGGVVGCIIGGIGGYAAGSTLAGQVYDWAEGTYFVALPEVGAPA